MQKNFIVTIRYETYEYVDIVVPARDEYDARAQIATMISHKTREHLVNELTQRFTALPKRSSYDMQVTRVMDVIEEIDFFESNT